MWGGGRGRVLQEVGVGREVGAVYSGGGGVTSHIRVNQENEQLLWFFGSKLRGAGSIQWCETSPRSEMTVLISSSVRLYQGQR